jgi:MFS family permease
MFSPGIQQIADDLNTTKDYVIGCTTGFVIMLGIGPLILAPLSETFGRRNVYIYCYTAFSIMQIPAALAPNIATLLAVRTISGFFGAVAIANGMLSLVPFIETYMLTFCRRWHNQWLVKPCPLC